MTLAAARKSQEQDPAATGMLDLRGEALQVDPSGVVWWPDERLLIVADLHLEKGASLASRGALIPPYDTAATLARLGEAILRLRPARVIALGDSFHDEKVSTTLPEGLRQQLRGLMAGTEWVWIAGNHDPLPPADIGGDFTAELGLGPLLLRHEPQPGRARGEVSGHLHPAASVTVRGRSLRRRCAACDGERMILPAFGAYTGGLNLRDDAFRGLFDPARLNAYMLGARTIHRVSGRRIGYTG